MTIAAGLLLTTCACSSGSALRRDLPPGPDYLRPVDVAPLRVGEDVRVYAARELQGREEANRRIEAGARWLDKLREDFARP